MKRIFWKLNRFYQGKWQLAVLDRDKGLWLADPGNIPYLKAENANGRHILIQPAHKIEPYFLLADDLGQDLLYRHHQHPESQTWKPGRMVIETSSANYQVWIHSSRPLPLSEKRFWLQKMGSDPGTAPKHRWGRCPGFFNRKEKHCIDSGQYPLSKLIWVDWARSANIPAAYEKNRRLKGNTSYREPQLPKTKSHIRRIDYNRNNKSATDFAYALALARRNFSKQQIMKRLIEERIDWTNHLGKIRKKHYLDRTVSKAINIIAASKQP